MKKKKIIIDEYVLEIYRDGKISIEGFERHIPKKLYTKIHVLLQEAGRHIQKKQGTTKE